MRHGTCGGTCHAEKSPECRENPRPPEKAKASKTETRPSERNGACVTSLPKASRKGQGSKTMFNEKGSAVFNNKRHLCHIFPALELQAKQVGDELGQKLRLEHLRHEVGRGRGWRDSDGFGSGKGYGKGREKKKSLIPKLGGWTREISALAAERINTEGSTRSGCGLHEAGAR